MYTFLLTALTMTMGHTLIAHSNPMMPGNQKPEIWMGAYNSQDLVEKNLDWSVTQSGLDVVEFYINMIAFRVPLEEYRTFLSVLHEKNIRIAIQCGYFDWDNDIEIFEEPNPKGISDRVRKEIVQGVGIETARIEMAKLKSFIEMGGMPDYLVLDGPVRRLMNPGADTGQTTAFSDDFLGLSSLDEALDEIVAYMRTWLETYPDVRFIVLTNFPNWGWKGEIAYWASGPAGMFWGDYEPVVKGILERMKREGLPLAGIRADNPYEYYLGEFEVTSPWPDPIKDPATIDWVARLLDLERVVKAHDVPFDLIFNSQKGGHTSGELFAELSLEFVRAYENAGGSPDRYVFESWYPHPTETGPETKPGTVTALMKSVIEYLQEKP